MRQLTLWAGLTISIMVLLTEAHSVYSLLYPIAAKKDVSKWFFVPPGYPIMLKWYIKFTGDYIFRIYLFALLCRIGYLVNTKLFIIFLIWGVYFVADYISFVYNYSIDYPTYYLLIASCFINVIITFVPMKGVSKGRIIKM